MSYINEYISQENLEKYNFQELNKLHRKGGQTSRGWTIDRGANIWLRQFYIESDHTQPDGGYTGISAWNFYWKGVLMFVEVKDIGGGSYDEDHRWGRKKLLSIDIPEALEAKKKEIVKDLEGAFKAHKGSGTFATCEKYSFDLEV
jgi:hypothetical protein